MKWADIINTKEWAELPAESQRSIAVDYIKQRVESDRSFKSLSRESQQSIVNDIMSSVKDEQTSAELEKSPEYQEYARQQEEEDRYQRKLKRYGVDDRRSEESFDPRDPMAVLKAVQRGPTTDQRLAAAVESEKPRGITEAMISGIESSTLGKALASYLYKPGDYSEYQRQSAYNPSSMTERVAQGSMSLLADAPIFAAGEKIGGPAGAFGLHSGLSELYRAKLAGDLENKGFLENALGVAKETGKGILEGKIMEIAALGSGALANELNAFRTFKALQKSGAASSDMTYKAFKTEIGSKITPGSVAREAVFGVDKNAGSVLGTGLQPSALMKEAVEFPTTVAALAGGSALVRGNPITAESLVDTGLTIGLLKFAHSPAGIAKKISPESRKSIIDSVAEGLGIDRKKAAEIIRSPEKTAEAMKLLSEKAVSKEVAAREDVRAASIAEAKKPRQVTEFKDPDLPNELFRDNPAALEPRSLAIPYEERMGKIEKLRNEIASLEKIDRRMESIRGNKELYDKQREMDRDNRARMREARAEMRALEMDDRAARPVKGYEMRLGNVSPETRDKIYSSVDTLVDSYDRHFSPEQKHAVLQDFSSFEYDMKASGMSDLTQNQRKIVLDEVERRIREKYLGEGSVDVDPYMDISREEFDRPLPNEPQEYRKVGRSPEEIENAVAEAKRADEAENAAALAAHKSAIDTHRDQMKNLFAPDKSEIFTDYQKDLNGVEQAQVEAVAKEIGEAIVGPAGRLKGWANVKQQLRANTDKFVSSMLHAVETRTKAGAAMSKSIDNYYADLRVFKGNIVADLNKALSPVLLKNGRIAEHHERALVDALDYGIEMSAERYKSKMSAHDWDRVVQAYEGTRRVLNSVYEATAGTGLKEFHPSVALWKATKQRDGWLLVDQNGKGVGFFDSEKKALDYRREKMYTEIDKVENYFPHMMKKEALEAKRDEKSIVDKLIESVPDASISKSGEMTQKQLRDKKRAIIESLLNNDLNAAEHRDGNIQVAREGFIPEDLLRRDISVLHDYIEKASNRIISARHFGVNEENLYSAAISVAHEASERYTKLEAKHEFEKAVALANSVTNRYEASDSLAPTTNFLLNLQVIRKMPTSALGQIPQMMAPIWYAGPKYFAKAVKDYAFHRGESKDFLSRAGINLKDTVQATLSTVGGTSFSNEFLKKIGFVKMDQMARSIAGLSGRAFAEHLADNLKSGYRVTEDMRLVRKNGSEIARDKRGMAKDYTIRYLEKLNLSPLDIARRGGLTARDRQIAAGKFEQDTNFRTEAADLPAFRRSNFGKLVTQFKTFSYQQTKTIRDHVLKEAVYYHNFKPLAYFLAVSGVGGAAVNLLRGIVTGRQSGLSELISGDDTKEKVSAIVGIFATAGALGMMDMFFSAGKYGDPQLGATMNDAFKTMRLSASLYSAATNKRRGYEVAKYAADMLPLGSRWRRTVQMVHNTENLNPVDFLLLPKEKVTPGKKKKNTDPWLDAEREFNKEFNKSEREFRKAFNGGL